MGVSAGLASDEPKEEKGEEEIDFFADMTPK